VSEIRTVDIPEKDRPLRDDISMLGQMLGEVLVEQHGAELLKQVEMVRRAAILRREGQPRHAEVLEKALPTLPPDQLRLIIRSFSTYLRLANLAEKVHRIRRNRTYLKQAGAPQRGSLDAVLGELHDAGVGAEVLADQLAHLQILPVFTAHPTEATRRSILQKEYSIIQRLVERLNPDLTPSEQAQIQARIRDAVTSGWQTRSVPHARPTVADELDNVLFYLTEILYRVVPAFLESLGEALEKHYGIGSAASLRDDVLRFGSWVGGDMDGNPNVTSKTITETLVTQRQAVIRRYVPDVRRMARYLSQTRGEAGFSPEFEQRLELYSKEWPEVWRQLPERHHEMPYRCFLEVVSARLEATVSEKPGGYASASEFRDDIALIGASLEANTGLRAGWFGVRRMLARIRVFGFHLATLDIRQDAQLHRDVMGELLANTDWPDLMVAERREQLQALLERGDLPDPASLTDVSSAAEQTLAVFSAIREAGARFGQDATGLFITSMTRGADDVLTVLALARIARLEDEQGVPLDVAPLLETVDDLDAGPAILTELLDCEPYRQHLARRGNRQVVMVGYSDSNKDSGIVAARWSLQQAQYRLARLGEEHGVEVVFFHGRGGTVSRGAGNLVNGIAGAPAGTVNGYLRVTEQGEVINQKYGMRPLALRNLELATGAVLEHELLDVGQHPEPGMRQLMETMAATARGKYRGLVYETPEFPQFFRSATPIDVIERLNIGSRPASRRSGLGIENLRAIPWVFSWAQTRVGLPGVFGVGTALQQATEEAGLTALREMYRHWRFFRGMVDDVEMVLAKSELEVGRRYAELAGPELRGVFDTIMREFDLATEGILELKQIDGLLDGQHTLKRNIRLRNPYVDPMHVLQIDLLRRWRDGGREDDELLDVLKATVNGIALGIQNTG
jgi:phosphoenolpyruvate carboxylase